MVELIKLDTLSEENFKALYDNVCKEMNRRKQVRKRELIDNLFNAWKALEAEGYKINWQPDIEQSHRLYEEEIFIN